MLISPNLAILSMENQDVVVLYMYVLTFLFIRSIIVCMIWKSFPLHRISMLKWPHCGFLIVYQTVALDVIVHSPYFVEDIIVDSVVRFTVTHVVQIELFEISGGLICRTWVISVIHYNSANHNACVKNVNFMSTRELMLSVISHYKLKWLYVLFWVLMMFILWV